ncbi:unnamed protein product [Chrysoparadoxa australica]
MARMKSSSAMSMAFELMDLPYAKDSLSPHISSETLDYHHGKHHQAYVNKLNDLVAADSSLAGKSLEEIMMSSSGVLFNQSGQIYNHNMYFNGLSPNGGGAPSGALADAINKEFGSFDAFKEKFSAAAVGHFGSGWVWLVKTSSGGVAIESTHDASNPLKEGTGTPLLTCDVWEHAYYIDTRNARPNYIAAWWNVANWEFASAEFAK